MEIKHLNSWTIFFTGLIFSTCTTLGQFNHKKPWPTYSLQNMPHTRFTCHDKILGGYYADPETQCQMFHVCVKVAGVGVQDFRFLCPNGTAFDQEAQICADWGDVDCEQAVLYYGSDNFDLYRLGSGFESKRAPLAEEEEATFHLQRAETGDIRQSKETRVDQKQSYIKKIENTDRNAFYGGGNSESRKSNYDQNNDFRKVSQKFEAPKKTTSSYYTTPSANDFANADSKQDGDELFKGSHSSNFFANRNGGREDDFNENIQPSTVKTTTLNHFFSGNVPRKDDFRYFEATTKRPHRGRRPSQIKSQSIMIPSSTDRTTTMYTTVRTTTVQDVQRATKRLTLQSSFNTGFNFGNDKSSYRSSTSSITTTTPSTGSALTQRTTITSQRYQFGPIDFQQDIHPTTYNPSGAFRYKTTTQKYEDINETALRGEKPGQNTFANSQYDNQNLEIFSRVLNRKSQNTERNIQKQQAKNITLANRNEFTDFTKKKAPTGFQLGSRAQQPENSGQANLGGLSPNVQPLDPGKLNSELRNINQTQQPGRGPGSASRFNNRQQAEPRYFRAKSYETPAPFTAPQNQQQTDNSSKGSGNFQKLPKQEQTLNFNFYNNPQLSPKETNRTRSEQRAGNTIIGESLPSTELGRTRNQQRLAGDFTSPQSQYNLNSERQRSGSHPTQVESTYNAYNSFIRTKVEPKSGNVSDTAPTASATPPSRGRGHVSYKANAPHQGRSIENFIQTTTSGVKKFSTLVPKDQYQPTTFKPTYNTKNAFEQKPKKPTDAKSRGPPYVPSTTQLPNTIPDSLSTIDEHDGQYHPELYEIDYTRNNVAQTKKPFEFISLAQSRPHTTTNHPSTSNSPPPYFQPQQHPVSYPTPTHLSDEEELFKTAHSLNLGAASINKLRADTLKTVDKRPQQSSPNFGFDRTPNPTQQPSSAPTITWRPSTTFIAASTAAPQTPSPSSKPRQKSKPKSKSSSKRPPHADADTSYDYAYYDSLSETPQEYPEYDVIADFRKTKSH